MAMDAVQQWAEAAEVDKFVGDVPLGPMCMGVHGVVH